jgi:radical SAM protein with 4Fe4S-binding SPASM domain
MSSKVFETFASEILPHLTRIQFGGSNFGEQLMASNWDTYFERVSRQKIGISLVSNGTLLSPERIKKLVGAGVEFNFSLEGIAKESYEAIRGYSFKKFLSIIEQTCEEKIRRADSSARVNLGFTASRNNIEEVTKLLRMAAQLGIDRVIINHFAPWDESQRQQSLVYHKELSNKIFEQAENLASELNLLVDLPRPFRIKNDLEESKYHERDPKSVRLPCYHPWESVSINERGDVMPCCATSAVMGNLEKSTFSAVWNGNKYKKLRRTVNSPRPLVFCRDCVFRGIELHSKEPISFCSDERFLLAAIGRDKQTNSFPFALRRVKHRLLDTPLGKKLLPALLEYYRRHGAFTVMDLMDKVDNGLAFLANRVLRLNRKKTGAQE